MATYPDWLMTLKKELTELERQLAELELESPPKELKELANHRQRLSFANSFVNEKREEFQSALLGWQKDLEDRQKEKQVETLRSRLKRAIATANSDATRWLEQITTIIGLVRELEAVPGCGTPIGGIMRIETPSFINPDGMAGWHVVRTSLSTELEALNEPKPDTAPARHSYLTKVPSEPEATIESPIDGPFHIDLGLFM